MKVAHLVVDDPDSNPAFRHHSFTLSGAHRHLFEVEGGALYLKANTPLDHEAAPRLDVTVGLDGTAFTADYRLAVENRNDMALVLDETARVEVDEGVLQTGHAVRAVRQDAAGGPVRYAVTGGQDAGLFTIDAVTGELRFLAAPDHERPRDRDRDNIHEVVVTASSASAVAGDGLVQRAAQTVTVALTDLNDSPPVFEAGDALPVREDVAVHDDAAQRGDAAVIHRVRARPDVDGDTVVYSLKEADDHAAFGISRDGEIWLRQRPEVREYNLTVIASVGEQSREHAITLTVENVNDPPTGEIRIMNSAGGRDLTDVREDDVLRVVSTLEDRDGLGVFTYRWERSDGRGGWDHVGADQDSYQTGQPDVGKQLRVTVSYIDGFGHPESRMSVQPSAEVANVNDPLTGEVTLRNTAPAHNLRNAREDQTLEVTSNIADEDGISSIEYRWERSLDRQTWETFRTTTHDFEVAPMTVTGDSDSHVISQREVDKFVRVVATVTDAFGNRDSRTVETGGRTGNVPSPLTGVLRIAGKLVEGQTLTADIGNLVDQDAMGPNGETWGGISRSVFDWEYWNPEEQIWKNLPDDQNNSYTLRAVDVGRTIRVRWDYRDRYGTDKTVTSSGLGPVLELDDPPEVTPLNSDGI